MISSTVFLYAATAFAFFASTTSATYKNGDDFFNALPTCIKKCNQEVYKIIDDACDKSSNNLECVCEAVAIQTANATQAATCSQACSKADQIDATEVIMNFAVDCLPYISDDDSNNSTTSMSSTTTGSTALPSGSATSSVSGTSGTTTSTSTGLVTSTTATSASGTAEAAVETQATSAGTLLLVNSLFIVAVPAILSTLFI